MKAIHQAYPKQFGHLPEKVLQFGEGNFLRAFADWMIEHSNRAGVFQGSVIICQPIERGACDTLQQQNGQYTVLARGLAAGERVEQADRVTSVSRCLNPYQDYDAFLEAARLDSLTCVISNTTEAGIAYSAADRPEHRPPAGYPAKLCVFLYERYKCFSGDPSKGLLVLPVELIDNNGAELKRIVLRYAREWQLDKGFADWLHSACCFASTLVDRIVTGYPHGEAEAIQQALGYTDKALVTCEPYHLWAIEADRKWEQVFPVGGAGIHVVWTDDVTPFKQRKVRILNGAHTAMAMAGFLAGFDTVLDCMTDPAFSRFIREMLYLEVIPSMGGDEQALKAYADSVLERFRNPFIHHRLLDIALNSRAKFLARCLPSLLAYHQRFHQVPPRLAFALAAFIRFYWGSWQQGLLQGRRPQGDAYEIRDNQEELQFFEEAWRQGPQPVADRVLSNTAFWQGQDLLGVPGLGQTVRGMLEDLERLGVMAALKRHGLS